MESKNLRLRWAVQTLERLRRMDAPEDLRHAARRLYHARRAGYSPVALPFAVVRQYRRTPWYTFAVALYLAETDA